MTPSRSAENRNQAVSLAKPEKATLKAHDAERPEQEAADDAGDGVVHRAGDPSHHHEHGDGEPVLGGGLDVERHEPDRKRHQHAQRLAQKRELALRRRVLHQGRRGGATVEGHAFPLPLRLVGRLVVVGGGGRGGAAIDALTRRVLSAPGCGVKARVTAMRWRRRGRAARGGVPRDQNPPKPKCRRWVTS